MPLVKFEMEFTILSTNCLYILTPYNKHSLAKLCKNIEYTSLSFCVELHTKNFQEKYTPDDSYRHL